MHFHYMNNMTIASTRNPAPGVMEFTIDFIPENMVFYYHLPLEKGMTLYLNKFESPLPKDGLCQVCFKLANWFWRRSRKSEKFIDRQIDRQMDGWKETQLDGR